MMHETSVEFNRDGLNRELSGVTELRCFEEMEKEFSQKKQLYLFYIKQYYDFWKERGFSQVAFCRRFGIPLVRFRTWKRDLIRMGKLKDINDKIKSSTNGFYKVLLKKDDKINYKVDNDNKINAEYSVVLELQRSGHRLFLAENASTQLIERVVKAVEGA